MKRRLTKTAVEDVRPGDRDVYVWDDRVAGFGVKVTPGGQRIYLLKCRIRRKPRWLTLGKHGEITTEEARRKALTQRGLIADGKDPAAERDAQGESPTMDEFADRYLEEWAMPHKKPRSAEEDRRNLKLHVRPEMGHLRAGEVNRQDVLKLHHRMRETPGAANRVIALLSKMFQKAEEWGLRPEGSNPARRIELFEERKRDRFLNGEELKRLSRTLQEAEREENPSAIAIIRLLVLTGCRLSEILTLQWPFLDFEQSVARLPDSKTGAKVVRLGAPALTLLAELPRHNSPFIFPRTVNPSPNRKRRIGPGHFVGIQRVWQRIRKDAGLNGVRIHDLRHTYGAWSVQGGVSLYLTGGLLGHTQPATTQRYAHLSDDPLQAAADRVSSAIASAMAGKSAVVTRTKRRT
jgi:integrase